MKLLTLECPNCNDTREVRGLAEEDVIKSLGLKRETLPAIRSMCGKCRAANRVLTDEQKAQRAEYYKTRTATLTDEQKAAQAAKRREYNALKREQINKALAFAREQGFTG